MKKFMIASLTTIISFTIPILELHAQDWRELTVVQENRCTNYDRSDYRYSQDVELGIIARMGGRVYGPYTGRTFEDRYETDIEHIVATSEAHDSGMCSASEATKHKFAEDQLNLTLAAPKVNQCGSGGKCGHDAAEWVPERNKCWFAYRVFQVKRKYALTVDQAEANALEAILSGCDSFEMVFYDPDHSSDDSGTSALSLYDDNGNRRISCAEARTHGISPVRRGHPAYPFMNDADGDGVVCE